MGIKADMIAGEAAMEELESIINGENFIFEDTVNEDLQSSVESDFSSEEENTTIEELDLREERSFSDEDLIDEDIELFRKRQNNPLFASFHTPYIDSVMNEVEDIATLVNIEDLGADTSPIDEAYPTPYDWVEYENDVAEVTAENNDIVEVFGEQFATIAATGGNLLSAWLLISAYFHVCKVAGTWVPGKLTKERSASLVSEYGHLILRAATKSVEEISRFTASLGSNNMPPAPQQHQQQQKQQQHLPPRWQQLFHEFSLQGFEHEDLMMQFRKLLGETSNPKVAETIFEQTFRNLSAETRLLNFAPALQQYFFFPHSSCSSPSNDETTSDDDDALRALITKFNPEANLMFLNNMKKNKRGNTRISEKEKGRLSHPPPPPSSPYPVSKRSLQSQGQSQEKKKKMQKTKTEKKKKKTVKKTGSSNDGSKKKVGGGVSAGRVMKKGKPVTAAAASGTKMTNSATTTSDTAATIGARRYNLRRRK
ncbi:uncharacterized protein SEPMUDRAFT_133233 [Sphaerulina musiva SO2202]|uniref:Uncharacterized protein n=1 Tax=Sphaerulina musiva (strain SO2202) TaxID=692275 RepID=M3BWS8_SPHMS|nr:uncharacterized protein SEPMUDRAFT_133233 [Sphaerulina musiva SO2202]EMF12496.1 hypothetical protein SEPMUDRAFT_133233 [Sphaerulina musiva SO2202]